MAEFLPSAHKFVQTLEKLAVAVKTASDGSSVDLSALTQLHVDLIALGAQQLSKIDQLSAICSSELAKKRKVEQPSFVSPKLERTLSSSSPVNLEPQMLDVFEPLPVLERESATPVSQESALDVPRDSEAIVSPTGAWKKQKSNVSVISESNRLNRSEPTFGVTILVLFLLATLLLHWLMNILIRTFGFLLQCSSINLQGIDTKLSMKILETMLAAVLDLPRKSVFLRV